MASLTPAQTLREEIVHNRPAWVLENGKIRVAVLKGGGHLAEIRLLSDDPKAAINPMRVPHYPTIDPQTYDPAKHDAIYGSDAHRFISSGYMGHLLCFPYYGPPSSEEEIRNGIGNHGEAPIVAWRKVSAEHTDAGLTLRVEADLPKTQFKVERAITIARDAKRVHVEEWVQNLTDYDRPFQWMQHATFGPPFVEPGKTVLDASATRGFVPGGGQGASLAGPQELHWPDAKTAENQATILRTMQPKANAGTYVALLMDPKRSQQFFTLYHPDYHVLIGYVFPTKQNPWLADWQENKRNAFLPWNKQVIARGLEFGNSPVAEGLRKAVERGSLFGVPAYQWIHARERLSNEFTVFLEEIPAGFNGVKDVDQDLRIVRR